MSDTWRTYTGEQARNVLSALHILLQGDLLDKDEQKMARSLQVRLQGASQKVGSEYTEIGVSNKEEDLLRHIEGSLWT